MTTDADLDTIYDFADWAMRNGKWGMLDAALLHVFAKDPIDEVLGWLTATAPAKSRLKNRARLYEAFSLIHPELCGGLG